MQEDKFDNDENVINNDASASRRRHESDADDFLYEEEGSAASDVIKKLRTRLKKSETERQSYLDGWQRCQADASNAKKALEAERQSFMRHASENFVHELLPVLDSFDMAFANRTAWEATPKEWRIGIEHIHAQLLSVLTAYGVTPIDPAGAMFDPALHTSIASEPTDNDADDHRIVAVAQKGYRLGDRVIRPARVRIALYEAGK